MAIEDATERMRSAFETRTVEGEIVGSPEPELAGPGQRFVAALLDGILEMVALAVPAVGIFLSIGYALTKDALPFLDGKSLGKRAMGIRVVREGSHEPITGDYGAAVLRRLSLMIPLFNIVDALMVILRDDRRRFGDRWANTIVVVDPGTAG